MIDTTTTTELVLAPEQRRAVELATGTGGVVVITGGPGTGKTTVCRQILDVLEADGAHVVCCSPTGKAARRLAEQTGRQAATIHRTLAYSVQAGGFQHGQENPLDADVVLVDEASMIDVELAGSLLEAIATGTRLILVGDVDQLPSVGPGAVLRDVIDSGVVPTVRLERIYRQSEKSWISANAAAINVGGKLHINNDDSIDFFYFEREDPEDAAATIGELVATEIPREKGLDPIRDIQVLCPQKNGFIGTTAMNASLQQRLNPPRDGAPVARVGAMEFRVRDKVMHVKNNYKLGDAGVFNGEAGVVVSVCPESRDLDDFIVVDFGDKTVGYLPDEAKDLRLSYAATIHKSQGSEFPCVVVPIHSSHYYMLSRSLFYTAITRGKQFVYIVGNKKGLNRAIKNAETRQRKTALAMRLRGELSHATP